MLWYERRADQITPGDFLMIAEPEGWHPRLVVRVDTDDDGNITIHYPDRDRKPDRRRSPRTRCKVYRPDAIVEMV